MKEIISILKSNDYLLKNDSKSLCRSRCVVSLVLCIAAALMLIMNLKNHSMTMAYASIVLVVGFVASAVVAGVFKKEKLSAVIIAMLVALVLSAFAITAGNEGFAALWILLVPLFAINILGVVPGIILSTYFLVFLFVLFHSPLSSVVQGKYTVAFLSRFPVLYMSDYLIASYYSLQREYYHRRLKLDVYVDGFTGAFNRRYYMQTLQEMEKQNAQDYGLVMVDLNGLKRVNDSLGHEAGDELIQGAVKCCKEAFEKDDLICRIGGDEFAVIAFGDSKDIEKRLKKLSTCAKKWNGRLVKEIAFAVGYVYCTEEENDSYEELMKIADERMYQDKAEYYQKHDRRKG